MANLETLKWLPARLALETLGRTSDGIRTGLRRGFSSGEMLDYVYEDRPSGLLVVTGQPRHPQLELIRNLLRHRDGSPWVMRPRPTEVLESWCRAAGLVDVHTTSDSQVIFTITLARRSGGALCHDSPDPT
jgi:hypothetical protein